MARFDLIVFELVDLIRLELNWFDLNLDDCKNAISEIQRVSNGKAFIQVDAYRDESELSIFKDWMLTAQTYLRPEEWMTLFKEVGYTGYYYWTILDVSGDTL